jgi:ferritin-like metal-binding protein YciE
MTDVATMPPAPGMQEENRSMSINTLDEKFTHELQDIYDAEHRFLEAQQQMMQQASSHKLQGMIRTHIQETEGQIRNLEQIFSLLGENAKRVKCDAAVGLVSEGQKSMEEAGSAEIRDCLIAGAAARVEHYEIASYRGLVMGAELMGNHDVLHLLHQNLQQEEQTAQLIEDNAPTLLKNAMHTRERGA